MDRGARIALRFHFFPRFQQGIRIFLTVLFVMALFFAGGSLIKDSPLAVLAVLGWLASFLLFLAIVCTTWMNGPLRQFLVEVTAALKTSGELRILSQGQLLADLLVSFWSVPAIALTALPFEAPFFSKYPILLILNLIALLLIVGLGVLVNRRPGPIRSVLHVRTNVAVSAALMFYVIGIYISALVWMAIPTRVSFWPAVLCFFYAAGFLIFGFRSIPPAVRLEQRTAGEPGVSSVDPGEQAAMLLIWGLTTTASLYGMYLVAVALYFCVSGQHVFPNSSVAILAQALGGGLSARLLSGLYAIPIASLLGVLVLKRRRECRKLSLRQPVEVNQDLIDRLRQLCVIARCPEPLVVIERSPLVACSVSHACRRRMVLRITDATVAELRGSLLDAVLYHEIYHVAHHARWVAVLESLGRWSLAGRGMLLAAIAMERLEYAADAFAVECLNAHHALPRAEAAEAMIGALETAEIINKRLLGGAGRSMHGALALADSQRVADGGHGGLAARLQLMVDLYFGDLVLFYRHPLLVERTKRLEALV